MYITVKVWKPFISRYLDVYIYFVNWHGASFVLQQETFGLFLDPETAWNNSEPFIGC